MHNQDVYQLVATILPNGVDGEKVQHDLGIWTKLRDAKKQMKDFVRNGNFYCPVYCYSIQFLPLNEDLEYQSEREINVYSPDGKLQIKEFNMISCGATWSKELNLNIRAFVDMGPQKKSYFVLYNHWRPGLATKCARISFLEPKYELGASYNKSIWVLNDREKEILCNFLKSPKERNEDVHNVWQAAIFAFNNEVDGVDECRALPYDLPMPDYMALEA
ncbi:hypothetical protein [Fibrobacter sp. UWP2]|uniref:hypothetical protein n=1 Tax=Fibrobacter sp. UWP2 TaxID=1896216 RepID=UPI000919E759|nr:hypothetical protein [Fibrobacter sp. UWP2]SHJ52803.1 hypothetical protein SAMN05720471_1575 [Fibrobacter sp. UWP2]